MGAFLAADPKILADSPNHLNYYSFYGIFVFGDSLMLTSSVNGRRSRLLRFESLESRLAMTALTGDAVTLAEYLAQPQDMGPALEQPAYVEDPTAAAGGESPVLDTAAEQVADSVAPAVDALQAEGEGFPGTTLLSFSVERVDGGLVRLSGSVSTSNPLGVPVFFGGLFSGLSAWTDEWGNFSRVVPDLGFSGYVSAQAPYSNIMWAYLA